MTSGFVPKCTKRTFGKPGDLLTFVDHFGGLGMHPRPPNSCQMFSRMPTLTQKRLQLSSSFLRGSHTQRGTLIKACPFGNPEGPILMLPKCTKNKKVSISGTLTWGLRVSQMSNVHCPFGNTLRVPKWTKKQKVSIWEPLGFPKCQMSTVHLGTP